MVMFSPDVEADLVDTLRRGSFTKVSMVAEMNEKVCGDILFSSVSVLHTTGNQLALSLAPMAVMPNWQQMGIGSLLVKAGLNECRKLHFPFVVVLSCSDVYPRFGSVSALAQSLESHFGAGEDLMA